MVSCAQTIVPNITGAILVMANPLYAYSTQKTIDNGQRMTPTASSVNFCPSLSSTKVNFSIASLTPLRLPGLYSISTRLQPAFDTSRLIVKVASTWEGLQACRQLKSLGVKTLATTAFTLEQCILAGEAGCIYVSPFLNELRAGIDPTYVAPPISEG